MKFENCQILRKCMRFKECKIITESTGICNSKNELLHNNYIKN